MRHMLMTVALAMLPMGCVATGILAENPLESRNLAVRCREGRSLTSLTTMLDANNVPYSRDAANGQLLFIVHEEPGGSIDRWVQYRVAFVDDTIKSMKTVVATTGP